MVQDIGGGIFVVLIIGIYLFVIVFVLTMLWRIASNLKDISHHLLEIAKDVKEISAQSEDEPE